MKGLTRDRTGNFKDGHLSSVLFTHRLDDSKYIELERWSAPGLNKPSFAEALEHEFQSAKNDP
jgi:alpha-mannosidase